MRLSTGAAKVVVLISAFVAAGVVGVSKAHADGLPVAAPTASAPVAGATTTVTSTATAGTLTGGVGTLTGGASGAIGDATSIIRGASAPLGALLQSVSSPAGVFG